MLTRGQAANHLYLQVVGDGDPHTLIRPETVAPRSPTELLKQILARDDTPPPQQNCCANSATQPRSCSTPSSATPTGSTWQPSSSPDFKSFTRSTVKPATSSQASPASSRGRPSEHISSRWRLRPGSTHSATCKRPPLDATFRPHRTWPLYSTGGSQSRHPLSLDRYPGFPAYPQRFMIITFGVNTWRSGRSSLSAWQIRSETAPAIAANSLYGHRRAAT
jgi:hypothetical protein